MGWCSGTDVFDPVVKAILEDKSKEDVIKTLIKVLQVQDWDCETDSDYFYDPIVKKAFISVNRNFKEYYED